MHDVLQLIMLLVIKAIDSGGVWAKAGAWQQPQRWSLLMCQEIKEQRLYTQAVAIVCLL